MSSCFILPSNFDKNSLYSSLCKLTNTKPDEKSECERLSLNPVSVFLDPCSDIDSKTNTDQSYFITFYTRSLRLQKDSKEQKEQIEKEWNRLINADNDNKSTTKAGPLRARFQFFNDNHEKKQPRCRATIDMLSRSQFHKMKETSSEEKDNNQSSSSDQDIIEEEEEEHEDNEQQTYQNNQSDSSDEDDDASDQEDVDPNIFILSMSRRGDAYDEDFQYS